MLDSHALVCEGGSTICSSIACHCIADEFGHVAFGGRQVRAVSFLVTVHALRVFCKLRIFHEVGLRAHVGILLRVLDRVANRF